MIGNGDGSKAQRATVESDEQGLTPDQLWHLLGDSLRRRALQELDPDGEPVALRELAERLADETPARLVAIRLHHNHLPKLAEYDLVTYDADANLVTANARPEWVEPYLER